MPSRLNIICLGQHGVSRSVGVERKLSKDWRKERREGEDKRLRCKERWEEEKEGERKEGRERERELKYLYI